MSMNLSGKKSVSIINIYTNVSNDLNILLAILLQYFHRHNSQNIHRYYPISYNIYDLKFWLKQKCRYDLFDNLNT